MDRFVRDLDPSRTVLLFGAGAARSSGAPLSIELCRHLEETLGTGERISDDLAELALILERRKTRRAVIDVLVERLRTLEPDGAMVALAAYPWPSIYTTNYDLLVEGAFRKAGTPLATVRSHFDWEMAHTTGKTVLYKLHGCISQDRSLGHHASMILTLEDYDKFAQYRTLLFDRLKIELAGNTVCILGHSLRDPDIIQLVKEALRLQREAAAPGRLHLLVHELDEERAAIWRSQGVYSIQQADLNTFAHRLGISQRLKIDQHPALPTDTITLPHPLLACTIDVRAVSGVGNPRLLYNGGPASYQDIRSGFTFERDVERDFPSLDDLATIILGVAGTGKTTLARRLLSSYLQSPKALGYEHRPEFQLDADLWLKYESLLRETGANAVLFIDSCTLFQRQLNRLVGRLTEESALHLILTAETSTWKVRQKHAKLFSNGRSLSLSSLSISEIRELINLVHNNMEMNKLIDRGFMLMSRIEQERTLSLRCSSDMFVCLKLLFSSTSLDDIILNEYANIASPFQDVYRLTAALEAAGAIVHRQMVLRLSGLEAGIVANALGVLEDLVQEQDRQTSLGIYVWRTRHEVIARILSEYKYSDPEQLRDLLDQAIRTAVPSYFEESRMLSEICNSQRGILALPNVEDRIALYRLILQVNPRERVARHRLVAELLKAGKIGDAEAELRRADSEVGLDPPLKRYRVRIHIERSRAPGLLDEDRRAILRTAYTEAEDGISLFGDSKYMYFAAADVAEEWFRLTGERGMIQATEGVLRRAEDKLLDPDIRERLTRMLRF